MKNKITRLLLSIALVPCFIQPISIRETLRSCAKTVPYPKTAAVAIAATAVGTAWYCSHSYERRENWDNYDLDFSKFHEDFKFGVATSDLQLSGVETVNDGTIENNWTDWEKELILPKDIRPWWKKLLFKNEAPEEMTPRIPEEKRMGTSTGHWKKYQEDFTLAKDFGLDSIRISLEMSKYLPNNPNDYNNEVLEHYIQYLQTLDTLTLETMLCFYHHALPKWFVAQGGFEKSENIDSFVNAIVYTFKNLKEAGVIKEGTRILTFNEPAGYVLAAYVYGKYPPGEKLQLTKAGVVLKNMLDAHIKIYEKLKEIDDTVQVSLAHMMQPLQPYNPWDPLDILPAKTFDYLLNHVTLEYLSTGVFKWLNCDGKVPQWKVYETNNDAKNKLDFIGVNYYTHTLLSWFKAKVRPTETTGDAAEGEEGKAIYPEGFYDSLKIVHSYFPNTPLYITEIGISTSDPKLAELHLRSHLYQIQKCLEEGITILGVHKWGLLRGEYGWNSGNGNKYGLFNVDYTKEDMPRSQEKSSEPYRALIAEHKRIHNRDIFLQKEVDTSITRK